MKYSLLLFCGLAIGCSSKTNGPTPIFNNQNPSYREKRVAAIASLGDGASAALDQFSVDVAVLQQAITTWQSDASTLPAAQNAFHDAASSWAAVEAWEIGPIADSTSPGGSTLSDEIYSWPTTNDCRVDQELVTGSYEEEDTFRALLVNARGLDAIEYLLWHVGLENSCPPQTDINTDGTWAMVTDLDVRRSAYAVAAVADVVEQTDELKRQFALFQSSSTAVPNELFVNEQEALNVMSGSLFFVDLVLKDLKLGLPLGFTGCASELCLEEVEYARSGNSLNAIRANLESFDAQFFGLDRFSTLLEEVGASDISDAIRLELDGALEISQRSSLEELATDDLGAAAELYAHVKAINDRLKTDFVGVLDLELPARAEGDND